MQIHPRYAGLVFDQSYAPRPTISGVELVQLPYQSDDGGNFSEIVRVTDGKIEGLKASFVVRQVSTSAITPGAIKAYHLHFEQDDVWYVTPTDRLVVNLHDTRADSKTFDTHVRIVLGGGKNLLLRIPKGVAHGVGNPYTKTMQLFYFTNQQFDIKQPDEHRLPWDCFGTDVWEIAKG